MNNKQKLDTNILLAGALIVVAGIAIIGLVWFSWSRLNPEQPDEVSQPSTTVPTQAPVAMPIEPAGTLPPPQVQITKAAPQPTAPDPTLPPPTEEAPTAEPEPTAVPTEAAPAAPIAVAGSDGVNVRRGPGVNYDRVGFLNPGTEAPLTGRYGDWWQIQYNSGPGWVYGGVVTASNTENVSQVQPPPAPTAVPQTATPVPPTATPAPAPDFRGLTPVNYWVEGAPGPFGVNQAIWFNWEVSPGGDFDYDALGTWVQETGQFQKSWSNATHLPATWRDHIDIPAAGSYHLWLRICFTDGYCANMLGPIAVTVQ